MKEGQTLVLDMMTNLSHPNHRQLIQIFETHATQNLMIGITNGLRILQESQREVLSHISSSSSFSLLNNESEDKPRPEDSNRNDTKYNRDKSQERFPPKSSARRPESKERLSSTSYDKKTIPDYRTKESEPRDARSSSYDRDKRKESSKDNFEVRVKDEKAEKEKEREKVRFSLL